MKKKRDFLLKRLLDTSVLKTENFVSNPYGIPFPDGLETEFSISNFDFSCSSLMSILVWNCQGAAGIEKFIETT